MTRARAPAVIKLFGEHAVVYGKLSIAGAIDMYANSEVSYTTTQTLGISLTDIRTESELRQSELDSLYASFKERKSIQEYIEQHGELKPEILPYATIAARISKVFKLDLKGKKITIESGIRMQTGLASSSAVATAFTVSLLKHFGIRMEDDEVIDIARDGDRIVHRNEKAGGIDVSTSFYGGYVGYSTKGGAKREEIDRVLDFVIIDAGPKKSTAETVGSVAERYKKEKKKTEVILAGIEDCSMEGLDALRKGNLKDTGKLMVKDHKLLKKLGVSTERLDEAVEKALESGAYGAKLSGGGGGGIAIALTDNAPKIVEAMKGYGFEAFATKISLEGAGTYMPKRKASSQTF